MFAWNPEEYARYSTGQTRWAHELMMRLALRGDEAILDVGCGDGKITAEFAIHYPLARVLGIDASNEMIEYARVKFPQEPFTNLSFRTMPAEAIELDTQFDLVFSNAALHWVADQHAVVRGVASVLRSGGRFVASCGGRGCAAAMMRVVQSVMRESQWKSYFYGFDFCYHFMGSRDYAPWLAEAGLRVSRLELVPKDMIHEGAEGLAGWLRTTWHPFHSRVPEPHCGEFIQNIVMRYLEEFPLDEAGRAHVAMVRLEIEATQPE